MIYDSNVMFKDDLGQNRMTFNELLKHRNLNGKVYRTDIGLWLGTKVYENIPSKDIDELQEHLTEFADFKRQGGHDL